MALGAFELNNEKGRMDLVVLGVLFKTRLGICDWVNVPWFGWRLRSV